MNQQQLTGLTESHLIELKTPFQTVMAFSQVGHDLTALIAAADKAGFQLEIASGFRHFDRQAAIWSRKFTGQVPLLDDHSQPLDYDSLTETERLFAILRWSALPSASRHHWGTDFDIYAKNLLPENSHLRLEPWEYLQGHQLPFYQWLCEHLHQYGFFFPYQHDLGGVAPEPWHISHRKSSNTFITELTKEIILSAISEANLPGDSVIRANIDQIYARFVSNISQE